MVLLWGNHNGRYTATIQIVDTDLAIVKIVIGGLGIGKTIQHLNRSDPFDMRVNFKYMKIIHTPESRMAGEYAEGLELADMWYYTVSGTLSWTRMVWPYRKVLRILRSFLKWKIRSRLFGQAFSNSRWLGSKFLNYSTGELVLDTDLSDGVPKEWSVWIRDTITLSWNEHC